MDNKKRLIWLVALMYLVASVSSQAQAQNRPTMVAPKDSVIMPSQNNSQQAQQPEKQQPAMPEPQDLPTYLPTQNQTQAASRIEALEQKREELEQRRKEMEQNQQQMQESMTEMQNRVEERIQQRQEFVKELLAKEGEENQTEARINNRIQTAGEQVRVLLEVTDDNGEIHQEIRVIASEQGQTQTQISEVVSELESDGTIVKAILGPNPRALEALKTHQERSQERILALQELQNKTDDPELQAIIEETLIALEEQQQSIDTRINEVANSFSLFGWLRKIINQ